MPSPSDREPNGKNTPIGPTFGMHLQGLRIRAGLSRVELADKSGVHARTVSNLETKQPKRAQQKTLLVLADALGVSYEELVSPSVNSDEEPAGAESAAAKRRKPSVGLVAGTITGTIVVLVGLWWMISSRAVFEQTSAGLVARDPVFKMKLWEIEATSSGRVPIYLVAPWSTREVLVGYPADSRTGAAIENRDRRTGKLIWQSGPDLDRMISALGDDMVSEAPLNAKAIRAVDIDGDGQSEVCVRFLSQRYHPAALCLFDRSGRLLGQYANKGHLYAEWVGDVDGDGAEEVLACGVNNSTAYGGPTIVRLDRTHWRGASIDSLSNPWSTEPDSSYARVVFPGLPEGYRLFLQDGRFSAQDLQVFAQPDGNLMVAVFARTPVQQRAQMRMVLSPELDPIEADIDDGFVYLLRSEAPDSLWSIGPASATWRADWLRQAGRFGAGRHRGKFADVTHGAH